MKKETKIELLNRLLKIAGFKENDFIQKCSAGSGKYVIRRRYKEGTGIDNLSDYLTYKEMLQFIEGVSFARNQGRFNSN